MMMMMIPKTAFYFNKFQFCSVVSSQFCRTTVEFRFTAQTARQIFRFVYKRMKQFIATVTMILRRLKTALFRRAYRR